VKKIIVICIILCATQLRAQFCDNVNLSVTTATNVDFSYDTFGKYLAGLTQNAVTKLKVTVSNDINNNPACRWNLVLYVENGSAVTANTDWEQLQSQSASGTNPKIEMLQVRVRNNCNTSLTGNQFFNVPIISGTPVLIISNTGITIPSGSCTTNVNGPGNPIDNYNEFSFDIDYRIVPTSGIKSGTYQLRLKYLLTEDI
jgi:hypothetical protein